MGSTTRFGFPYPASSDSPNGPAQMQALAEAVDAVAARAGGQSGKSIISAEQSRTNTSYGLLGTPDRVQNVVLPADGLIYVLFQAMWKETYSLPQDTPNSGNARAAIFLGSNQLQVAHGNGAPVTTAACGGPDSGLDDRYGPLFSCPLGLVGLPKNVGADDAAVTTGQVVGAVANTLRRPGIEINGSVAGASVGGSGILPGLGGACAIFAAAGTYDVSVRFKAASGVTVYAKNRKLWVWTQEFS